MQFEIPALIDLTSEVSQTESFKTGEKLQKGVIFRMSFPDSGLMIKDNGGTRSGRDRRKLSIINRIPERRIIEDRRSGQDRRCELECRDCYAMERGDSIRSIHKNISYRQD